MTTDTTVPALDDASFMAGLLDTLIPPSEDGRPGAGSIGLGVQVAEAVRANAEHGMAMAGALDALRAQAPDFASLELADRVALVDSQFGAAPAVLGAVITPLYYAYYQHASVLIALGVPARPPYPEGYEVEATDAGLLEGLRARTG